MYVRIVYMNIPKKIEGHSHSTLAMMAIGRWSRRGWSKRLLCFTFSFKILHRVPLLLYFFIFYFVSDLRRQRFIFYRTTIILERRTAKPLPPWLHLYCSGFPRLPFTSFTEAEKAALFELFNMDLKTLILESNL